MAAASTHDLLLPRAPGGLVPGAALALLAHAAMIVALTTVVNWRASTPEAVTAELWSAVPQVAAPAPPPPAPTPPPPPAPAPAPAPAPPPRVEPVQPDPQIAIARAERERERERQERAERAERERQARDRQEKAEKKAEQDRADKERARKERELQAKADAKARAEAEAKKARAEEERLAQQRQKNLERLMGQVGSSSTSATAGTAAQSSGPSASYAGRLVAAIKPNIVFTEAINGNPAAEVEVRAGPSGSIIARRIVRSSGNKEWDEAVLRAIDRTSSLPRDVDGRVPPTITMVFRPQE